MSMIKAEGGAYRTKFSKRFPGEYTWLCSTLGVFLCVSYHHAVRVKSIAIVAQCTIYDH